MQMEPKKCLEIMIHWNAKIEPTPTCERVKGWTNGHLQDNTVGYNREQV